MPRAASNPVKSFSIDSIIQSDRKSAPPMAHPSFLPHWPMVLPSSSRMEDFASQELIVAQQATLVEYAAALLSMNYPATSAGIGPGVIKPCPLLPGVLFPGMGHPLPMQYQMPMASPMAHPLSELESDPKCAQKHLPPMMAPCPRDEEPPQVYEPHLNV